MKRSLVRRADQPAPSSELVRLRRRLAEAEGTLRAIRSGEVDVVVVSKKKGLKLFTLEGAGEAYRLLIESMNEGAVTLTADKTILYANACFARMVKSPLEQVMGSTLRRFLTPPDLVELRRRLREKSKAGAKLQVQLIASDGTKMAAQISFRLSAAWGTKAATIAMVVTDMTEAKRTEGLLRELTHRVVQVQESERANVALELHDHITQLLCAILFRCQALVDELSARQGPSLQEAMRLREMLSATAKEVERISHNLRPGALEHLGLGAVVSATTTEFADRTGCAVKLTCVHLPERLPAPIELALYRILQGALKNVERHARARHVTVELTKTDAVVQLTIKDDGVGFDVERRQSKRKTDLGLLAMGERAAYVGGMLTVKSVRRSGTEIVVRIPLAPSDPLAN